ncbi:cilia- and flagella-associated protein 251-like [Lytechinus variegatus]|uniref:cilia- and flagella-associated protein 251-like n=1 Tax=Lytechinus variegatus TaxID=7654 RepID=UPI001BB20EDE|nr:cilia- and flagella-associated protein 251-like [Lytechinus variegatus]
MPQGLCFKQRGESPLFEPEEENEGNNEVQLDVIQPMDKKDDEDVDEDTREEVMDANDEDSGKEKEEEKEDKEEEHEGAKYSGIITLRFEEELTEKDADEFFDSLDSLGLPRSIFSDIKVKGKAITVHVNASSLRLTPQSVGALIASEKEEVASMIGLHMAYGQDVS